MNPSLFFIRCVILYSDMLVHHSRVSTSVSCLYCVENIQLVDNMSIDDCLGDKREDNQNISVLYCARHMCTTICTHMSSFYTFFSIRLSLYPAKSWLWIL